MTLKAIVTSDILTVPAIFANVVITRRHTQNGVFHDLHLTAVYFRFFRNFSRQMASLGKICYGNI